MIAAQKDGGLVVFDLGGGILQVIAPAQFGAIRNNNVDLLYNFKLGSQQVDLAIVSDRENDTLAIFKIDARTRRLIDVTSNKIPETIFGIDDGNHTAYGLCTYISPATKLPYAFVTQGDGNQVAQLLLEDDDELENISSNFKLVPWQNVARKFSPPLLIDPQFFHPRKTQ